MANKDFMDPELTEEEKRETILANEDDYLEGLLAAADNAANDTRLRLLSSRLCRLWMQKEQKCL